MDLNLAKSAPHVNRALPMTMWKFFFSLALIFRAAYAKRGFEHSAHSTVNIVLAACCLAGLNGILWPQSFNVFNDGIVDSSVSVLKTSWKGL